MYQNMYESSKNSAGSAMDENEKFMKSLQARINLARVEVEKLALAFGDAFLTEGMIQGLKVFGNFLNGFAKLTESIGALPVVLGVASVGIALLSKSFRNLMTSAGMGVVGLVKYATSSATATGANRTLTVSTTQLTNAHRVQGQTAVTAAMATRNAAVASTAATTAASASIRTMLLSTGAIGVAFVAIGAITEAFLSKQQKSREMQEKIASENKQLVESYSQNKGAIESLSAEYSRLEEAMKVNPSIDTQQRYYEVQNELATLLPSLVSSEDSYGNKLLISAGAIESRIGLIERQVEAEQRLQDIKDAEESAEELKNLEEMYNKQQKLADLMIKQANQQVNGFLSKVDYPTEIKNMQDMEVALAHFIEQRDQLYAEGQTDNSPDVLRLNRVISKLEETRGKYQEFATTMDAAQAGLAVQYSEGASEIIASNDRMNKSVKDMTTDMLYDITGTMSSLEEIEPITNLFSSIGENEDLLLGLRDMNQGISTFKNSAEEDFTTLEATTRANFSKIKEAILSASGLKVDSVDYSNLASGLDVYINKMIATEEQVRSYANTNNVSIESARAMVTAAMSAGDGMGDMGEGFDDAADSAYALKDAIDLLSGVSGQLILDSDELIWMMEVQTAQLASLKEGTIEYAEAEAILNGTKEQLLKLYPHLFAADATAVDMTSDKIKAIAAEVDANDILRAAYSASRDGKLTSEQESTLANLANTNARINNINKEIIALNKLAEAYNHYAAGAINTAKELRRNGDEASAQDAEIRARKWAGYSNSLEKESSSMLAGLASETAIRTKLTNILKQVPEVLDRGTTAGNKNASANRKAADAAKKSEKATKDKTKAEEDSYETITKNNEAIEKSIYLANKYEQALEKVTHALERQQDVTSNLPDYSEAYRKSLEKELKLQREKKKILEDQAKSLQDQIKKGEIIRYGTTTKVIKEATTTTETVRKLAGWGGAITSGYGYRIDPITGKRGAWHGGTDIKGNKGDRLDANVNGKVTFAGNAGNGFGNYVMVQAENGIKHIYAHLSKVAVKIGDKVATGMKLGEIGSTGRSTGNHLHYETRDANNKAFNSLNLAKKAQAGQVVYSQTSKTTPVSAPKYSGKYAKEINAAAAKYNVNAQLIAAMIKQESNFNPKAVSHAGAKGLMQLMPGTARGLGVKNSFDPMQNIMGGTKYIAQQLKSFGGDIKTALAAYNAGPGNVRKYNGIPPFKETQNYVKKVMATYNASGGGKTTQTSNTTSTSTSKTITETSKDEAATKQAIDEAKSKALQLKQEAYKIKIAMQAIQEQIVESDIADYEYRIGRISELIGLEASRAENHERTSPKRNKSMKDQIKLMKDQEGVYRSQLAYLNKMYQSDLISARAKAELFNKIIGVKDAIVQLNTEMKNMTFERILNTMQRFEDKLDNVAYALERTRKILSTMDEGSFAYTEELKKQLPLLEQQKKLLKEQRESLQRSLLIHDLTPEKIKEIKEMMEDLSLSIWDVENAIKDTNKEIVDTAKKTADDLADALIDAYKSYIEEKRDMHEKSLDKEMKAEDERHKKVTDNLKKELDDFRKIVQARIDEIDRQENDRDYNKEIDKLEEERMKVLSKINLLALDDSLEAKAERKKLQEELDGIDENISEKRHDREVELRKESLSDMIDKKEEEVSKKEELENEQHEKEQERIDKLKEYWNQFYTDQLNNEAKFAKLREDIVAGNFDKLSAEFQGFLTEMEETMPGLENTLDGTMQAVGTSIRQNIINSIKEALELLQQVKKESGAGDGLSGGGKPNSSSLSGADLKVIGGKFMNDRLATMEENSARRKNIKDKAHALADQGRLEGSTVSSDVGFDQLIKGYSEDDKKKIAEYFKTSLPKELITPYLQNFIQEYALGIGGTDKGKNLITTADLKVLGGKFMNDRLTQMESNPVRKGKIKDKAHALADEGRAEGSTIKTNAGFDDLIAGYSIDDRKLIGRYFQNFLPKTLITPYLQDYIKDYAHNIMSSTARFDTGGFTGKFKGGKIATLHEEELVLNKKHTKDYFSAAKSIEKLQSLLNPLLMPSINRPELAGMAGGETIEINFNVENMNATRKEADGFVSYIQNSLRRNKGMK